MPALAANVAGIADIAAPPADPPASAFAERRRAGAEWDETADPIERALRIGAAALGAPLAFTDASARTDDDDDGRAAFLPQVAFDVAHPVLGDDGETLGTLRALSLTARPPFGTDERRMLADIASVIGGEITARERVGRFDHVTRLPNRIKFEADFARLMGKGTGERTVLLVTLAEARQYNELLRALGHAYAESFVRRGAEMVAACSGARPLYHVSVLSVAFMIDGAEGDATAIARDLVAAFAEPVKCDGIPITTRIGVGLTRCDPKASRPAETLRAALAAAQDSRRVEQGFCHYDRRSDEAHLRAFNLLTDLGTALHADGQLSLVYQPRIDLANDTVAGAEALIRWNHPTLGAISPAEFIPLAETTALINPLTDWVLATACRQSSLWAATGPRPRLSINVAPTSLHDDGFLERIARIFAATRVDPADIEFEFTEGTLTSSDPAVCARIDAIRATGTTIAIDDFGTGYSNLDYLTRLPADVLKIDRSFVQPLDLDPRRRKLVRSLIDMAHDLDFRVVAEGVETASAYASLGAWGCDEGQGYFMSRPLNAEVFTRFAFR